MDTFKEKSSDSPAITELTAKTTLLMPRSKDRTPLVARLMGDLDYTLYYAAGSGDESLSDYIQNMIKGFVMQIPTLTVRMQSASLPEQARLIAKAINQTSIRLVVLDDIDRVEPADRSLFRFLTTFAESLNDPIQLVISSRSLDFREWQPLLNTGDVAVIGDAPEALSGRVEVFGFGVGNVFSDGKPIKVWDGPLPRSLFFYFADHPMITRTEVFGTFWPDLPPKDATNVFHVTKRKVAERIGYETMIYTGGFYQTATDVSIYYDVADFEACITRAQRDPDDIEAWERAAHLYRAPFLHRMNMPWVLERRAELATQYTEALIAVGRFHLERDPKRALNFYLRAQREAPHREDIYQILMQLHADEGDLDMVEQQYQMVSERLKAVYNITPGRRTRDLYEQLRRK